MKIITAIKQVPMRDSQVRVAADGKWYDERDLSFEINEPDAYALEEALLLKEKHGGEVVVLCAGPERAAQTIREALAKGADRAIHLECDDLAGLDTLGVARRLAAAAAAEKPDLILTGLQSDDLRLGADRRGDGRTAGHAARHHHHAGGAAENSIRVKRELEDGWFQWVEMPLPALLTIQSGISKLRYATLMGIKKAKTKEVRRVTRQRWARRGAALRFHRARVPAGETEGDPVSQGDGRRSRGPTGGDSQVRGASHMNGVLVVLSARERAAGLEPHVLGSARRRSGTGRATGPAAGGRRGGRPA